MLFFNIFAMVKNNEEKILNNDFKNIERKSSPREYLVAAVLYVDWFFANLLLLILAGFTLFSNSCSFNLF